MQNMISAISKRYLELILIFLIIFAVTVVFMRTLDSDFVRWDDGTNITQNPFLTHGISIQNLAWMFSDTSYMRRWVPLSWLVWNADFTISGLNPRLFHFNNLFIHIANTVLVFLIIRRLLFVLDDLAGVRKPKRLLVVCAAIGALLWAIHPLRVEVVAWVSGYMYGQALFFLLISALSYLYYVAMPGANGKKKMLYGVSVAAFAASLLTYPIALAFPIVLVILDIYPLLRLGVSWKNWKNAETQNVFVEKIPFFAIAISVFAVTLRARIHAGAFWGRPPSLETFGVTDRIAQAFYMWARFLWKTLWPMNLSPVYTALVTFNPLGFPFALSALAVIVVTIVLWLKRFQYKGIFAVWFAHLVILIPFLGLTEHPYYPSDRYSYVVSVIWAVPLAAALSMIWSWWGGSARVLRALGLFGVLCLAAWWSILSFQQIYVWKNSETLFRYMITELGDNPYRSDILWRLGVFLADNGRYEEAIKNLSLAVKINPRNPLPRVLLQLVLKKSEQDRQIHVK
ncbi:tetratricopeptide repeat protein [Patescibacteria group bacterium]|nr:tetratricopeptide repeat protein [Patescibacteria group bacterium]